LIQRRELDADTINAKSSAILVLASEIEPASGLSWWTLAVA
jgi:hypothetical protein